ncbi:MAG: outer membrane lipoprotein-sorting protein [Candidatus Omnitrophica bacterium]|nr:outer membrane lipoprotein-sorting protein [Candidatus Omnitrophota bacterium]
MTYGKRILWMSALFTCIWLSFPPGAAAQELSGGQIMEKSYFREDGNDAEFKVEMILIDRRGRARDRTLMMYFKDYGNLRKTFLKFTEPADIEGTKFLSWETENGEETQYLYLPALGRSKRIVSSQRDLRFVNTDFTYEDMERREPGQDTHRFLRDGESLNRPCFVVESVPKPDTSQYGKRVSWVTKDSFVVVAVDFYDTREKKIKELRVKELEEVEGIPTAMKTIMKDLKEDHRTVMKVEYVEYNQGLADTLFTLSALERN